MQIRPCLIRAFATPLLLICVALLPAIGAAQDEAWRFVVLSDTRSNPCADGGKGGVNGAVLGRIAAAVVKEKPDVVLVAGDLVLGNAYRCGPAEPLAAQLKNWRTAMGPVYDAHIPVLPVRGNHELLSTDYFPTEPCRSLRPNGAALQAWLDIFGPDVPQNGPPGQKGITFAYPHKNALFVGLDELAAYLSYDPAWLDATLKANKRQHLFVYGH
ncbi:MAG TPA: metallophosphoesterase family protein, partial [Geobacteraceae bacterium]